MALLSIIGVSGEKVNWTDLKEKINPGSFSSLEIFPIPNSFEFESDAIGICIPSLKAKNVKTASELKQIIELLEEKFEFTELYNGTKVSSNTIWDLCAQYLSEDKS